MEQPKRQQPASSTPEDAALNAVFWKYDEWPAETIDKVVDFRVKYGIYPNSLTASKSTLDKLTYAISGGQMKRFTGKLGEREDDGGLGHMDLSRIKRDFKECRRYTVDDVIEYGLPQLFTGLRIVSPVYKLVLQVDDEMQENLYRLSYQAGIEERIPKWEKQLDERLQEDDKEDEKADDSKEDKEAGLKMLNDLLHSVPEYKIFADAIDKDPIGFTARVLGGANQDKDLKLKATSIFLKKHLVVATIQKLHHLKPQDPNRPRYVNIEVLEDGKRYPAGEGLGFTSEDVFEFFEGSNPLIDELLCNIMYLTESDNLSPHLCEVQGNKISFIYPIKKDKMKKIIKGGHAKDLDDSCQKVAGVFKERFGWKGNVQFVFQ